MRSWTRGTRGGVARVHRGGVGEGEEGEEEEAGEREGHLPHRRGSSCAAPQRRKRPTFGWS